MLPEQKCKINKCKNKYTSHHKQKLHQNISAKLQDVKRKHRTEYFWLWVTQRFLKTQKV